MTNGDWEKWFAWFPVPLVNKPIRWRWLCTVYRKRVSIYGEIAPYLDFRSSDYCWFYGDLLDVLYYT